MIPPTNKFGNQHFFLLKYTIFVSVTHNITEKLGKPKKHDIMMIDLCELNSGAPKDSWICDYVTMMS